MDNFKIRDIFGIITTFLDDVIHTVYLSKMPKKSLTQEWLRFCQNALSCAKRLHEKVRQRQYSDGQNYQRCAD